MDLLFQTNDLPPLTGSVSGGEVKINKKLVSAFARALRTIGDEKKLTQEQVAYGEKLHPTYISFLEGKKRQPRIETITFKDLFL